MLPPLSPDVIWSAAAGAGLGAAAYLLWFAWRDRRRLFPRLAAAAQGDEGTYHEGVPDAEERQHLARKVLGAALAGAAAGVAVGQDSRIWQLVVMAVFAMGAIVWALLEDRPETLSADAVANGTPDKRPSRTVIVLMNLAALLALVGLFFEMPEGERLAAQLGVSGWKPFLLALLCGVPSLLLSLYQHWASKPAASDVSEGFLAQGGDTREEVRRQYLAALLALGIAGTIVLLFA